LGQQFNNWLANGNISGTSGNICYFEKSGLFDTSLANATIMTFDWLRSTVNYVVDASVDFGSPPQFAYSLNGRTQIVMDTGNILRINPGDVLKFGATGSFSAGTIDFNAPVDYLDAFFQTAFSFE
jgi:hypothetical protein